MATQLLNQTAYEVDGDNLILGGKYPVLMRKITIVNPQVALKRGMAVINSSGTLYIAGATTTSGGETVTVSGDIAAILAADADADTTHETVEATAYVCCAANAAAVKSINSWDATTQAHVLGAQGNGIYLL